MGSLLAEACFFSFHWFSIQFLVETAHYGVIAGRRSIFSTSTFDHNCLGHLLLLVHHGQWPCQLTLWAVLQIEIYCGIDIFIGVFVSARYAIAYIGKNRSTFAPGRQPPCHCHYTEKTYHCHQGRQSGILLLAFRNNADNHPGIRSSFGLWFEWAAGSLQRPWK